MAKGLRILVVDDQPRTRQSLKALLATQLEWIEMREAGNGTEAIRCVEDWKPDVVLMDARMSEMDGVEATRIIKEQAPQIKVVILSLYPEYQAAALAAGADDFVIKGDPPERLLAALAAAAGSAPRREADDEPRATRNHPECGGA